MLAGAAGIEAVLLIVAADEGVKPQTVEHFDICRLLGIKRGIIALTKTDLAGADQLATTRQAVDRLRPGSFLSNAPVIEVSAVTRKGLSELQKALEHLERKEANVKGFVPRLPIDRSFALKGFGTVVTGTLSRGSLHVGDTVTLLPGSISARIRGLQVHGAPVSVAKAGQRTAVNLSGLSHSDIQRGFVLTYPDSIEPTATIQAAIDWLTAAELPDRREDFLLHIGTSEVPARVKILSTDPNGRRSFVQLNLAEPIVALPDDHFVLRRPSPSQTIGGGIVLDPFPPKRLNRARAVGRLERLLNADLAARLELLVEEKDKGRPIKELVRLTGNTADQIKAALGHSPKLLSVDAAGRIVSRAWLAHRRELLVYWLKAFHEKHASLEGAPIAQARLGLEPALANLVLTGFEAVRIAGDLVALSTHKPRLSDGQTLALTRIEQEFRKAAYQPQPPAEVLRMTGSDPKTGRSLLENLIKNGKLVRVSEDLVFHAEVIARIRNSLAAHKGRRFSIPEFKEWTQLSRKYAVPLLEYLDHQRVTKRDGDSRVVL